MQTNTSTLLSSLRLLVALLSIHIMSGCGGLPTEPPLCVPLRPVLENISVQEQQSLRDAEPSAFHVLARNDAKLKSHVRVLEGIVLVHDEPLGSCD